MHQLRIRELHLVNIRRGQSPPSDEEGQMFFDIVAPGAFQLTNWCLQKNLARSGSPLWWHADTRWSTQRIGFSSQQQAADGATGESLQDLLMEALHEVVVAHTDSFQAVVDGEREDHQDIMLVKPSRWKGKTLVVPVDFIQLSHIVQGYDAVRAAKTGTVLATQHIGYHLTDYEVAVMRRGGLCEEGPVLNRELKDDIWRFINRQDRLDVLTRAPTSFTPSYQNLRLEFDGFVPGPPPPIYFE